MTKLKSILAAIGFAILMVLGAFGLGSMRGREKAEAYPNRHPAPTIVIANDYDIATGIYPLAALFSFDGDAAKLTFQLSNGQGFKEVSWAGTSDRHFKKDITDYDGVESLKTSTGWSL